MQISKCNSIKFEPPLQIEIPIIITSFTLMILAQRSSVGNWQLVA